MGIIITNIRINNFKSIENINVDLGITNILIGQNNAGKSNFLKAIDIAINGSRFLSEDDIFICEGEHLSKDKKAIIDMKICPFEGGKIKTKFDDFWVGAFTDKWIITDEINGSYVGIRSIIEYDAKKNDYVIVRKPITEWNTSIEDAKVGKTTPFTNDMYDYINHYYMDAKRDITEDLRDRKSYLGRATSKIDLSEEQLEELEKN